MAANSPLDLLACAALEPALGGILFIDLDPTLLAAYAEALAAGIEAVEGRAPVPVVLSSWTSEEQLWPHWGLTARRGVLTFAQRPGLLSEEPGRPAPLVVIPDLARVSTGVTRAAVSSIGAGVVHVERQDISVRWPPTARWIAACSRSDIPALSPHLLDRFQVRWDGARAEPLTRPLSDHLRRITSGEGRRRRPEFGGDALEMVLRANTGNASIRRSLALGRLARAVAERRSHPVVTRDDVIDAGELLGLARSTFLDPSALDGPDHPTAPTPSPREREESRDKPIGQPGEEPRQPVGGEQELAEISAPEIVAGGSTDLGYAASLYPEDDPEAVPEAKSLQWNAGGRLPVGRSGGAVIGHESAGDLRDLAVVPTLLRAFWRCRRADGTATRLHIIRDDLRRHRREHRAQRLLVLVLDHTARRDWDCSAGVAASLRWAYEQTAAVSVIEFGHRGAADELRPERYRARSVVDHRIMISFGRPPGIASPLAAAIDMADEELRRFMHRGWAAVHVARLVVVTDGRGNVPLEASADGHVSGRVGREGVDDALAAASGIANLRRVETTVVAPVPQQYRTLPEELALALGGTVTFVHGVEDAP